MPSTFESKGEDNKSKSKKKINSAKIAKTDANQNPNKVQQHRIKNLVESNDYFGPQYNSTSELPNPDASLQVLATGVVEVIAGTRSIDQLARLLSDEVYQRPSRRAIEARQRRDALGEDSKTRKAGPDICRILPEADSRMAMPRSHPTSGSSMEMDSRAPRC